jgi:hypothetical protein
MLISVQNSEFTAKQTKIFKSKLRCKNKLMGGRRIVGEAGALAREIVLMIGPPITTSF